ncbi:hypothetical protein EUBSIR_01609 [[Eubacterium] siraeum DSM 15702]|uniref:Uncharacterized protein n=1 Tax=[Eubacterium] siraeum DSM 15702 TaxID=428128 RepID=B0MP51_9FIRM|nr:hypothetical protein EUBSIR_01609 [[Eubacterium] siraeum DSM 15702]
MCREPKERRFVCAVVEFCNILLTIMQNRAILYINKRDEHRRSCRETRELWRFLLS